MQLYEPRLVDNDDGDVEEEAQNAQSFQGSFLVQEWISFNLDLKEVNYGFGKWFLPVGDNVGIKIQKGYEGWINYQINQNRIKPISK